MALGSTSITAITREQWRSQGLTSLYGRRSSLDVRGYQCGTPENRLEVDPITTTAASSLKPTGISCLCATPASSGIYSLLDAAAGVYKAIIQTSTPALGFAIQLGANANIVTSAGSSFNQVVLSGIGAAVNLFCVSSSTANGPQWAMLGTASTGVVFSTY